jgi:hypothetical protein
VIFLSTVAPKRDGGDVKRVLPDFAEVVGSFIVVSPKSYMPDPEVCLVFEM